MRKAWILRQISMYSGTALRDVSRSTGTMSGYSNSCERTKRYSDWNLDLLGTRTC